MPIKPVNYFSNISKYSIKDFKKIFFKNYPSGVYNPVVTVVII